MFYVNNEGVIKSEPCNEIAKELWVRYTSQNMCALFTKMLHTFLECKMLSQAVFLETSTKFLI